MSILGMKKSKRCQFQTNTSFIFSLSPYFKLLKARKASFETPYLRFPVARVVTNLYFDIKIIKLYGEVMGKAE